MLKRMIIVVAALAILFGLVFGYNAFRQHMINKFVGQMVHQVPTISTELAKVTTWYPTLRAVGSLTAVNGIDVNSEVPGQVVKVNFQSGQEVKEGDILVQLNDSLDQQTLKSQQAQYNLNKQDYARKQKLALKKAISQDELDRAQTQMVQSEAAVATAQLNVDKKQIKAPFAGRLGISQVNLGEYVSAGQALVTLQQLDPLFVDFSLPEQQVSQLFVGQKVELSIDAFPNQRFSGAISAINSKVDVSTRTISVRATIPNPKHELYPGIFAVVNVALPREPNVVTVPQTAVAYSLHGDSVYVVTQTKDKDGKPIFVVEQRFVQLGDRQDGLVAVTEGLHAGEEVVVSGQLKLQPGMQVNINNSVKLD